MSGVYKSHALLHRVSVASSGKKFTRIGVGQQHVQSLHLIWHDATSNASAIKVYSSNLKDPTEPTSTVNLEHWYEETGLTFTGPAASAAGSEMLHVGVLGCKWLLFEYDASANSLISLWIHGKGA